MRQQGTPKQSKSGLAVHEQAAAAHSGLLISSSSASVQQQDIDGSRDENKDSAGEGDLSLAAAAAVSGAAAILPEEEDEASGNQHKVKELSLIMKKIHRILSIENPSIVVPGAENSSLQILNPVSFVDQILPKYFSSEKASNLAEFADLLQSHGFVRNSLNPNEVSIFVLLFSPALLGL